MNATPDPDFERTPIEFTDADATMAQDPSTPGTIDDARSDATTDFGSQIRTDVRADGQPSSKPIREIHRIIGGYRITELLGEGGMGRVFRATDSEGRSVALKLLSPKWAASSDALKRFKQEGYIASQINHPHCVFVHRVDEEQGTPFIAMELMTGLTMKDLVASKGPLPYREVVEKILQCIDGLMETHSHGMIHRDVKPANCYLDEQGRIKIGDFGLARSLVDDSELTQTGTFLGTPLYASPEQILGEEVDAQSDIYSLSATMYFLLAGRAPFESPNAAQVIAKIASADPPAFSELGVEVPLTLEKIVLRGLARDRSKRYANFESMRDELLAFLAPPAEVASLTRRCIAGLVDSFALSTLTGLIVIFSLGSRLLEMESQVPAEVLGALVAFLYYFLQECSYGSTLGKKFLRLQVIDKTKGGKARPLPLAVRAISYVALWDGVEVLFGLLVWDPHPILYSVVSIGGQFFGIALILFGLWLSSRRQLMFEWLSGTETVLESYKQSDQNSRLTVPAWTMPLVKEGLAFEKLGPFVVHGRMVIQGESAWYLAEDITLQRDVWIQVQLASMPPLSEARRACVRKTRLRFLQSGTVGESRWDAFLAPNGFPLAIAANRIGFFPWPIVRKIIGQVLGEYFEQGEDRLEERFWTMSRIWIDESGKITFSEVEIGQCTKPEEPGVYRLLAHVAKEGLPSKQPLRRPSSGTSENPQSSLRPKTGLEHLIPLRALQFLEKVAALSQSNTMDLRTLQSQLKRLEQMPSTVTSTMRFSHAAGTLLLLSPWLLLLFCLMMINSVSLYNNLRSECRKLLTMEEVLRDEDVSKLVLAEIEPKQREVWLAPDTLNRIDKEALRRFEQSKQLYSSMSAFERMVLSQSFLDDTAPDVVPVADSVTELLSGKRQESKEKKFQRAGMTIGFSTDADGSSFDSTDSLTSLRRNYFPSLDFLMANGESTDLHPIIDLWKTFAYSSLGMILWTTLCRGGLLQYFTGISIARRDGRRANHLLCGWRMVLILLPFALTVFMIQTLSYQIVDGYWWIEQWRRMLIILPILYLTATFVWPQASVHDWLSDTAVVPR